jgi:hypothetical protein
VLNNIIIRGPYRFKGACTVDSNSNNRVWALNLLEEFTQIGVMTGTKVVNAWKLYKLS